MIGRTLDHYRIESKLGEGGMGVVYKARDTHLDRFVAIKVLPPERVADPERKRRFVQEAKAASALNHPNIIHIYDIDQQAGVDFMAMEYVPGKTLDELIPRKGMRLSEALKCAVQVADALAKAHAAAIVHRDLKPGNVMVSEEGRVKVLDFGLAKLAEAAAGAQDAPTRTMRPQTEEGTILGTVAYMSPEQAEGRPVDARADIFSFGSLLYEMATGRRAFQGDSRVSTLAAVLRGEPKPLRELLEDAPQELERIIALCLRKDPARRFQHMEDLKVALEALKEDSESGALREQPRRAGSSARARRPMWYALPLAIVLLAVAGSIWWLKRSPPAPLAVLRRLTADSGLTTDPALSPDAKLVAYASDRSEGANLDIWLQHLAGGEPLRLTRHPADDLEPTFSPDGSKILFRSEREGGGLYVISALGGEERLLVKHGHWPRYSPDGGQIAYSGGPGVFRLLHVMSATGGSSKQLPEIIGAHRPIWSPDGKNLLVSGADFKGPSAERQDWWIVPVDSTGSGPAAALKTGAVPQLSRRGLSDSQPCDWREDRVVFSARLGDSTNLWWVAFSPKSFRIAGDPQRLTFGTGIETQASLGTGGRMAFSAQTSNIDLWMLPIDANHGKTTGSLRAVTSDAATEKMPGISADGKKLIFASDRMGNDDIWFKDLDTGKETVLAATPWPESLPVLSGDGSKVLYYRDEQQKTAIYSISAGGGVSDKVCEGCGWPCDWSRDQKYAVIQYRFNDPLSTLGLLDLGSGAKAEIVKHARYRLYRGHLSPDQRWMTFHADDLRGRTPVIIAPFRGAQSLDDSEWITVSEGEAFEDAPRWSPDGNLLYYLSDRDGARCLWAQRLDPATKRPLGGAFAVQHSHGKRYSIAGVPVNALDICVAGDKVVFNMAELKGNIWVAELLERK